MFLLSLEHEDRADSICVSTFSSSVWDGDGKSSGHVRVYCHYFWEVHDRVAESITHRVFDVWGPGAGDISHCVSSDTSDGTGHRNAHVSAVDLNFVSECTYVCSGPIRAGCEFYIVHKPGRSGPLIRRSFSCRGNEKLEFIYLSI